jgi:hypothetical protein
MGVGSSRRKAFVLFRDAIIEFEPCTTRGLMCGLSKEAVITEAVITTLTITHGIAERNSFIT